LIKEQSERMERVKYNNEEVKKLREKVELLKQSKPKKKDRFIDRWIYNSTFAKNIKKIAR
jgi:hypothetical protein